MVLAGVGGPGRGMESDGTIITHGVRTGWRPQVLAPTIYDGQK